MEVGRGGDRETRGKGIKRKGLSSKYLNIFCKIGGFSN